MLHYLAVHNVRLELITCSQNTVHSQKISFRQQYQWNSVFFSFNPLSALLTIVNHYTL